ncbi:hypothetical protein MMMDOFMJ_2757 [Methylobacterium gnaphalii]|uniref:Glycosyltransferase 61 catalytic domain-containing protein n=2 Tax=Methylobacterium gnaphalii TaxID=1010610 RepID=A0A512JM82_9HYPH|nr:hypothetical protein MGN01_28080 [Methylobacterium gnaphalii]GJD69819.1 hypothetical protein MMMDOFMJ_2757 [Methylobacterium gnaphalii]GLS48053.1 hypothetical protein GCM10007885_08970 [Methylobacterium gnaphalii]
MARGRAAWKRALDSKLYLTRAMLRLERSAPSLTSAIGYHAILGPPSRFDWLSESRVLTRMTQAPYAEEFHALSVANVDAPTWHLGHPGHSLEGGASHFGPLQPLEVRRLASLVPDVIVPGHNLLPVDAATGRLLAFYGSTEVNWGIAYPGLSRLKRERLKGAAWAIPPVKNYFHLLVEHILPVVDMLLTERAGLAGSQVTVITQGNLPLLDAIATILKRLGIAIAFEKARPFVTYAPEQYLFCKPVAASVEHFYAYPDAVGVLREAFGGQASASLPSRLYVPRTGTRIRRLIGEPELIAQLAEHGFSSFTAHRDNPEEQIARFMAAREIVSVHGAALTNIVWAAPGARVVEIFPSNARKTTYLHMASLHDHAYAHVSGGSENERQDFAVDPAAVLRVLGL